MPADIILESITLNTSAVMHKTITADDITQFAQLTGDHNPIHVDAAYAETTPFRGCIAHGAYLSSLISTIIATKLPGPGAIYISQHTEFFGPAKAGDHLTIKAWVSEINETSGLITIRSEITNLDQDVIVTGKSQLKLGRTRKNLSPKNATHPPQQPRDSK